MLRKILVVDDSNINRQMLCRILSSKYEVLEAENGEIALNILKRFFNIISAVLLDIMMPVMDGYEVLQQMRSDPDLSNIPVIITTGNTEDGTEARVLSMGANDFVTKPYNPEIIRHRLWNTINLRETAAIVNTIQRDKLTGLYNREAFFMKAEEMICTHEPGYYVMACFDIDNFKVINDQYGNAKGDEVLKLIADIFLDGFEKIGGVCGRIMADNFALLYPFSFIDSEELKDIRNAAAKLDGSIGPISFSIGRYIVNDLSLTGSAMYDRAAIAEMSVKARFDVRIAHYDEAMRVNILREHEIINEMNTALKSDEFEVWLQPQYNHSSGALIGAEALVRWRHPKKGLIPPIEFIPVFERNGFIYEMDKYVWEQTCILLRKWLDAGIAPVPLSVNISRYDIFREDFYEVLTGLVERYSIPLDLLRLEITESAFTKSAEQIISVTERLNKYGFIIEIDDFGSGYSSLNTLKDVLADILKLDMRFLESNGNSTRGGNILESIIRMAKWLGMPVIAEGVETKAQADYLKSIGCNYVQGYLYAKPMPISEYEHIAAKSGKEPQMIALETVETMDNNAFWDPKSMDTLVFNSYVSGACIFEYHEGKIELLRVNEKYVQELGGDMSVEDALSFPLIEYLDEHNFAVFDDNIQTASKTGQESTCELYLTGIHGGREHTYLRTTVRVIARVGRRMLFYCAVINVTAQREAEQKEHETAEQIQVIMNSISDGLSAATLEGDTVRYIFVNDRYYSMYGYTREQFEAELPRGIVDLIHPDDLPMVLRVARAKQAEQADTPFTLEYRIYKRDGSLIWVRSNASICRLTGYNVPVQLAVTTDITNEKESEQRILRHVEQLRFLNDMARDLLTQEDTDDAVKGVLQRVLEYFGGARAYVIEMDYERGVSDNTYEICAPGVSPEKDNLQGIPFGIDDSWFHALDQDSYISIADVEALDERWPEEQRLLKEQDVTSLIAVPLRRSGQLAGFLGVDDPTRQQSHVPHLQAIGDYLAAMLVRRDLIEKMKSDNKILIELMNDTPCGFARMKMHPDGGIVPVYFNDGFCKLVGMDYNELMAMRGENAMVGVHPDDLEIVHTAVQEMIETGACLSSTYRLRHGSGKYIGVMFFGRMTKGDSGDVFLNIYYTDMSEQIDEIQAVRKNELVLQLVTSHSNRMVYCYDIAAKTAYAYVPAATAQNELIVIDTNMPESNIEKGNVLPESVEDYRRVFREIEAGQQNGGAKLHILAQDKTAHWIDLKYSLIYADDHAPELAVLSFLDITDDHKKELAYDRYLHTIEQNNASEGGLIFFEADLTADVTEKYGGLILPPEFLADGHSRAEIVEYMAQKYVTGEQRDDCREFFSRAHLLTRFSDGIYSVSADWSIVFPDGSPGYIRSQLQIVQDPYSGHIKAYTILRNVTDEMRATLDVRKQAELDGMTGLYNKTMTETLIKQRLARNDGSHCALLVADLDNLKSVNDDLGHDQGDEAIRLFAKILRSQFRHTDIVGRIGGDEFAVFLDGGGNEIILRSAMMMFMKRLSAIRIGVDKNVVLRGSIGITIGTVGEESYEELFKKADKALYHVKRNGKNDFSFYTEEMEQKVYQHKGNNATLWQTYYFDNKEFNHLLKAISAIYPLVILTNFTRNSYYIIQGDNCFTNRCFDADVLDDLIAEAVKLFYPDDKESFAEALSRPGILSAYARGEKVVSYEGRQHYDDGTYRFIHIDVIFIQNENSVDIIGIILARENDF